jgi:peptidoglycan-N-acetylglucosamine deacetylase
MTWSLDILADDWTHITHKAVLHLALSRIEAKGKGILLLHDIQPATAVALPELLHQLKVRGFKIELSLNLGDRRDQAAAG